jgi:glycosyltransferase involved in cell wall biosynthesis
MKLVVQIPCLNEERTLPQTLADIPREIRGVDRVEILVIDDGSTDNTVQVAKENGADHILRNKNNKGLARTFLHGVDACLALGADVIVNTDGDNQYCGADIAKLVQPILEGKADVVVGDRQTDSNVQFSKNKKRLQKIGSWVVRKLSGTDIPDAVSGFRAFSREAALQMNIVSPYSYTIETIIQAGKKHLAISHVPIRTNPSTRESRLIKSIPRFIERSVTTMVRIYTMYQPLRVFFLIGGVLTLCGTLVGVRFLWFYFTGNGGGHTQSLIFVAICLITGFQILMIGLVADVVSFNRRLSEEILFRIRRADSDKSAN